jgi:hypothetical protein
VAIIHTHHHPRQSCYTIYKQFTIRWNNSLVLGLLSQQWAQAASLHHTTGTYEIDICNGHIYRTIRALHQFTVKIWEACNQQLHKHDDEAAGRIGTPIDAVIKHLYHQPNLLHATNQFCCDKPLAVLTKLQPANKCRWVQRVQHAQARYVELLQKRRQLPLSKYPSYKFTFQKRPNIVPNTPITTSISQQTLLSDTLLQQPQRQRPTSMVPMTTQHPRQRQTTILESIITAPT